MTVTEESRHRLHQALDETIGPEEATTLMEHLPPVGWSDVATKQDLATLQDHIDQRFEVVELRFAAERTHGDHRFDLVDHRFDTEHAYVDHRFDLVDQRFDAEHAYVDHRFDLVDHRFAAVDLRFDAERDRSDVHFGEVDLRFVELDKRLGLMVDTMGQIQQRLAGIETRLTHQFWQFLSLMVVFGAVVVGVLRYT